LLSVRQAEGADRLPQTNSSLHIIFRVYPLSKQVATRKTVFTDRELKIVVVCCAKNEPCGSLPSVNCVALAIVSDDKRRADPNAARRLVNSQKPPFSTQKNGWSDSQIRKCSNFFQNFLD
jgi:hypothetical protein